MELARPGDIVVIAGKGHEQGQEFEGGRKIPFDDREVARDALRGLWRAALPAPPASRSGDRLTPAEIARAAGARIVAAGGAGADDGPRGGRRLARGRAGDLFVGLRGRARRRRPVRRRRDRAGRVGSGRRAGARRGTRRARRSTARACSRRRSARRRSRASRAHGSQRLREHGCRVVGITGSTGKTSTKDILHAMLAPAFDGRVHANRENFNTEIGLPLTVLEADAGVQVLVLEMAMRGMGQIRELAQIARPEVGVITNIGPGAPRAGRHGRARRGGQGGADRGAARRARACVVPAARGGAASAPARGRARRSPSRPGRAHRAGAGLVRAAGADVHAAASEVAAGERARGARVRTSRRHHNITNALAAIGGRARARHRARGARRGRAAGALLGPAGRGAAARRAAFSS